MIGALPQTPEFIAFVCPKMGRKNRRQKSAAHFGAKSVQPLRSHSCVAVSCRTEKANYIINNCLEDYSIYTVCATLPKEFSNIDYCHVRGSRLYNQRGYCLIDRYQCRAADSIIRYIGKFNIGSAFQVLQT